MENFIKNMNLGRDITMAGLANARPMSLS